jgi:phage tail sheath protein FI
MAEPTYPSIYVEEVPSGVRPICGVPTSTTGIVVSNPEPAQGGSPTETVAQAEDRIPEPLARRDRVVTAHEFDDLARRIPGMGVGRAACLSLWVRQFFENGGAELHVAQVPDGMPLSDGLRVLDEVENLGLLCLPGEADAKRLIEALTYADEKRAFLIVDPPDGGAAGAMDLMRALAGTASANAAVYFPDLWVTDAATGEVRTCPPSGAVAGLYARTDRARGVWKAPAGAEAVLLGGEGPSDTLGDQEAEELNAAGVCTIRLLPTIGTVVWGARTVQGTDEAGSDWKYVPVRRLGLFLERSIERGLQWAVFEPNDEPLWATIRSSVGAFLHGLFRAGAFQGEAPNEAYFVKCDRSTMTQDDLDNGRVNVTVGFAPVRPAEFVVLRIGLWAKGFLLQVDTGTGWTTWTRVDDLESAGPDDHVFALDAGSGNVRFGDGVHGARPPDGARVQTAYRYGSGREGNVGPDPCAEQPD